MSWSDGIALVQAVFLASAAFFAARAYRLATREHAEERKEAAKAPLRELHADVIRELKELATVAQLREPSGSINNSLVAAHQARLAIALTFLPADVFNLFATKALTTCGPADVTSEAINSATTEQLRLFDEIESGKWSIRKVALPSILAQRAHE